MLHWTTCVHKPIGMKTAMCRTQSYYSPPLYHPLTIESLGLFLTVPSMHNELILNLVALDSEVSFAHVSSMRTDLGISMR